ncbi:esterase/lipase family protein [Corynebacterium gerontici]|uniref:Extracellular esterase EstB n=1 Tax=Corynebacterium gerontici TaxID=2079234 RepID=A0A3G6J170_9CORY|nr:alpha/beta fold hydrolase [Corynebacterium gerontici]AZA11712.1 Extracellular esterase EstB precursor [Corynebacterium gerontici]
MHFRYSRMIAVVLSMAVFFSPSARAQDVVAPWTGMGQHREAASSLPQGAARSSIHPYASPPGANVECAHRGQPPVILLHGMSSNAYAAFSQISQALHREGRCVFAINYGYYGADRHSMAGRLPGFFALAPMEDSLQEVSRHIAMVKEHTGAQEVDLVGWSEGGALAAAYAKRNGGHDVRNVVTLAGVLRGTSALGMSNLEQQLLAAGMHPNVAIDSMLGPAGNDLLAGSAFMNELIDGAVEVPGVHYTAISTLYDEAATPLSATQFSGGDHRNIVLQEGCQADRVDHLGIVYDQRAIAFVLQAVGERAVVPCGENFGPIPGKS